MVSPMSCVKTGGMGIDSLRLITVFPPFTGGYENFQSNHPELCNEAKTVVQSDTETEKRALRRCEPLSFHKPDYDQV